MGVLGEHIPYTQSPRLHNAAAAQLGFNVAYLPLPMPAAQVAPFLDVAWHLGAVGFSVTTPHKALVASLLPGGGQRSVNTLYRGKTWWEGASTDGEGFARGLARIERTLADFDEVVMLGSGGASMALLAHLAAARPDLPGLKILRRTAAHDGELRSVLAPGTKVSFADLTLPALAKALKGRGPSTLLIQGTSAPQRGDDLGGLVPALDGFGGAVVDLVYGKPSALYFSALARDLVAQDGEAMLIEQARLAQKLWWGKAASYADMALALRGK